MAMAPQPPVIIGRPTMIIIGPLRLVDLSTSAPL